MRGDQAANWKYFKASWNKYCNATELDKKVIVAILLSVIGKDCSIVYEHWPLADSERADPAVVLKKAWGTSCTKSSS